MGNKVLIIDDDQRLCRLLSQYLGENGFLVRYAHDGPEGLTAITREPPDMVILDIMLPGKDGLEVLKEIRRDRVLPVIMLTAKGDDTDRIVGLELGADDYLAKPFNPRELLARVKAVLRRSTHQNKGDNVGQKDLVIHVGGVTLNGAKQTVTVAGREFDLSTTEYRILEVMMRNPNTVLTRDQLMTLARGREFAAFDRSIDVHVSKLRAKVEPDPRTPTRIKTVWGSGYMFVDAP